MSAAEHTQGAGAANAFDKYTSDKTGIAAGLSKGHVVVKYTAKSKTRSRSLKKNDKTLAARQIARRSAIKNVPGLNSSDKFKGTAAPPALDKEVILLLH